MRATPRLMIQVVLGVAVVGAAVGFLSGPGAPEMPAHALDVSVPDDAAADGSGRTFPGLDPRVRRVEDGATVADLDDGSTAILSLDPGLTAHVEQMFEHYQVPYAALVAMEPTSGRVLAYVSHSSADPDAGDVVLDPTPPTASIFKVITAAALVDEGVSPDEEVCFHGGASRLRMSNLEDNPDRDRNCATLSDALGGSVNSIFGKLADRHLDPPTLERYASAFGFGQALPFDVPTRLSPSEVPTERLEFARTAAGFWHMHMSPLHGALIAATIANDGEMPRASLVDQVIDSSGGINYEAEPQTYRRVIPRTTARRVGEMMRTTVESGTARRSFFDRRGNAFLPGVAAAGKTGTLSGSHPYRGYTWFIGFAPVEDPEIAVSVLVVNEPRWRIKAAYAAREALRYWLIARPRQQARLEREAERRARHATQ